jgi:hypothetical protein
MASTVSSVSMPELPNLPGVRRDLSLINPKLYREYKASMSQPSLHEEPAPRVEEENSLMSFFENSQNKVHEFSQILSPFPANGGSYNDISGRYSLVSQQQDRLKKTRSLPYTNMNNLPSYITNEGRVCSFIAYFTEVPREGIENRSRVVFIKLFLENNSIEMIEPRVENSGTSQGKFLKRHQVYKTGTKELFSLNDFYAGAEVEIYNRIYTVIDCDNATKKIMQERGLYFGEPVSLPETVYDPKSRAGMTRAASRKTARETKNKDYFQYDTKVLRFYGVWDCRSMLFGDEINVKLHYSLAENTIEVVPINGRNSGRDRLPKLLKKTSILKPPTSPSRGATGDFDFAASGSFDSAGGSPVAGAPRSPTSRGNSPSRLNTGASNGPGSVTTLNALAAAGGLQPNTPLHWTDLKVGLVIPVASMTLLLCDADEFTREFYKCKNMPLDVPITRPPPQYPTLQTTIPPYNGFGSEEDSLQTCKQTLVPSAPSKDGAKMKALANMILRYEAVLADPKVGSVYLLSPFSARWPCFPSELHYLVLHINTVLCPYCRLRTLTASSSSRSTWRTTPSRSASPPSATPATRAASSCRAASWRPTTGPSPCSRETYTWAARWRSFPTASAC